VTAPDGNRALAGRILGFTALLMLLAAGLIWFGTIPVGEPLRTYLALALGAAGAVDLVIAVFFLKGNDDRGRI
jgi:hypothetical protein